VHDPDKLLHKRKENTINSFSYVEINLCLPKDGVKSIDDLDFDLKFEQTLFRSRSKSNLNEIIFDEKKFQTLISTTPIQIVAISTQTIQPIQTPLRAMVLSTKIITMNSAYKVLLKPYYLTMLII
jgi:hypothetical protein